MISVVIPCRNEERNIAECVNAIYSSKLDDELEVLVIDGMSDDGTRRVISELQKDHPTLRLVENEKKVTPVAFNLGIRESKGDYVQIVGARQIISADYLAKAKQTLIDKPDVWCVGGMVENVYQSEESERIGLAMGSSFGVGGGNFRILKDSTYVDTVGTPMYPSHVFDKIGLFDESLLRNQDDEYNYRLTKAGGKIYLNTEVVIKYYVRASVKKLFKQYMQYGYWKVYVNKMHATVTTIRQLIPFLFVTGLILGAVLSIFVPYFVWVYLAGLGLYLLMALLFGIRAGKSIGQGVKIAMIFPVLHLSYGWGYLKGIIHFFIFGKNPTNKASELSR
jgi:GT2 family glycosyltransferase